MKPQIILIGAGNIGSRHLQALALLDRPAQIFVVEPSEDARSLAKSRFESVYDHAQALDVTYLSDLSGLPEQADVAIVATSSRARRAVVEELCYRVHVSSLILEKVAFQSLEDLYAMQIFFAQRKIRVWVDCVRRCEPFYQKLRERMRGDQMVHMLVDGGEWGIGCNGIHELDLYAYLTGATAFQADASDLDEEIIDSKRKGYVEFTGELRIDSVKGRLTLRANRGMAAPGYTMISSDQRFYLIDEVENRARYREVATGWKWQEAELGLRFVSQVTQENVESILDTGDCPLASFDESIRYHEVLLQALLGHFNKVRKEERVVCPIT